MLRKLISALILFTYLYGINISLVCLAGYNLEYNYIVKYLCEKKDIPDNDCRGKCFLKKILDKSTTGKDGNEKGISASILNIHLAAEFNFTSKNYRYIKKQIPFSDDITISRTIPPEKLPPRSLSFFSA